MGTFLQHTSQSNLIPEMYEDTEALNACLAFLHSWEIVISRQIKFKFVNFMSIPMIVVCQAQ